MTDDARDRVCGYCGEPTSKHEFFTLTSGRRWAHGECMRKEGAKLFASGKLDDLRLVIDWPDGITEISTGKQHREDMEGKRR